MKCSEIAAKIEKTSPDANAMEVARICALISSIAENESELEDHESFMQIWQDANLRLSAASDQHAAVTEELEELASTDPRKFDASQIWVLVRAINIQSHVLQMYVGNPSMDLSE